MLAWRDGAILRAFYMADFLPGEADRVRRRAGTNYLPRVVR